MNRTLNFQKNLTIFGIPLMLIGMMILLAKSSFFPANPDNLSIGITFDLLITVPLVYFLLIRKTSIPRNTVIPLLIVGMVVGSIVLPAQNQYYLDLFKTWVFPIVEISIISFVIYKVSQAIKGYKTNQNPSVDFYTGLKTLAMKYFQKAPLFLL